MPSRRRVLFGAYACGPVEEPEAGAGWAFAVAAARDNDVWIVTRNRFSDSIQNALRNNPKLADRIHVVHMDLPKSVMARRRHSWDVYWYYMLWQRKLTSLALDLHERHQFDVLHHITFANDWLPCGLTQVPDIPLIWGPVGGSSRVPYWKLARWLGPRGLATESLRDVITSVPRRVWGNRTAVRASLVIAQNDDVAKRFERFASTVVEPNASLDHVDEHTNTPDPSGTDSKTAVFVGRLIGWKGTRLALDVIAHPSCRNWQLRVYGDGYDRPALMRKASNLGISDRVSFLGHRPRTEVLAAFEDADAMLFPSMHDQAGWVAAEASSVGCPVVCLPLGGPPLLAEPNAFVASLEGDIVTNVATQLLAAGETRGVRHNRWSRDRLPDLVSRWYDQVSSTVA